MSLDSAGHHDAVPEGPSITREVVSFSVDSANALKAELGLDTNDLLVGIPAAEAVRLNLTHGENIKVTVDGEHLLFEHTGVKIVTRTPKGDLAKIGLSKGIRRATGFQDHRETGTGTPDTVTLKVIMVGEQKAVLLQKA